MEYLSQDRMSEAEVALLLAFHLLSLPDSQDTASIALDGAQIYVGSREIFPLSRYLQDQGWRQIEQQGKRDWHGRYERNGQYLEIHSKSGVGDVVVRVGDKRVRAECKKGSFLQKRANPEYKLLREAIGQLVSIEQLTDGDLLVVAVPDTDKFRDLVMKWRNRPLIKRAGIQFALVSQNGAVEGLDI
jgi:hypothetical protein